MSKENYMSDFKPDDYDTMKQEGQSYVMDMGRAAASVMFIKGEPNIALSLLGTLTDREGKTVDPDISDKDTLIAVIVRSNDAALDVVRAALITMLDEPNLKAVMSVIEMTTDLDQKPVLFSYMDKVIDDIADPIVKKKLDGNTTIKVNVEDDK